MSIKRLILLFSFDFRVFCVKNVVFITLLFYCLNLSFKISRVVFFCYLVFFNIKKFAFLRNSVLLCGVVVVDTVYVVFGCYLNVLQLSLL